MNDHRNDELMHYGVLGMKWGRRKSNSSSSSTRTGSKTKQPSEFKKRSIQNKETRAGAIGVPVGLAVATAGNFASGAHYYARQQSAYGNARARYENRVKR